MYIKKYEILCTLTSGIIVITSTYILIETEKYIIICIIFSGVTSCATRLYRIYKEEYVMDHPIVYTGVTLAMVAFSSFILAPFDSRIYYPVIYSFCLMIVAAIMSWDIFPLHLIEESFYFQSAGHVLISFTLIYYIAYIL